MSALRYSRPGIAGTTLVDLGPDTPHPSGHRFYLLSEVSSSSALKPKQPERKGTINRPAYSGPRCGYLMPKLGEVCYRRPHGGRDHRSEASVKADIQRRHAPRREERGTLQPERLHPTDRP